MAEYGPREVDEYVRLYRSSIIWTNQRTGSQVLYDWFANWHNKLTLWDELLNALEKHGYNIDRNENRNVPFDEKNGIFKDVVLQYKNDNDKQKFSRAISLILWHRPSFRIITEYTNNELMEIIIKKANDYHYSNLFLYRRNSIERIMSLYYAEESGNFSSKDWKNSELDLKKWKCPEPDDAKLEYLVRHEIHTREQNIMIWRWMQRYGCRFASVSYEDMFSKNADTTILHITFRWLFYNIWDFTELRENGKIGDNIYYMKMKCVSKLEELLDDTYRPTFSNMHVEV